MTQKINKVALFKKCMQLFCNILAHIQKALYLYPQKNDSYDRKETISTYCRGKRYILTAKEPVGTSAYAIDVSEVDSNQRSGLPTTWDELSDCLKGREEEYERGEGLLW